MKEHRAWSKLNRKEFQKLMKEHAPEKKDLAASLRRIASKMDSTDWRILCSKYSRLKELLKV